MLYLVRFFESQNSKLLSIALHDGQYPGTHHVCRQRNGDQVEKLGSSGGIVASAGAEMGGAAVEATETAAEAALANSEADGAAFDHMQGELAFHNPNLVSPKQCSISTYSGCLRCLCNPRQLGQI